MAYDEAWHNRIGAQVAPLDVSSFQNADAGVTLCLRMLVPDELCGIITGMDSVNIKRFQEQSEANIRFGGTARNFREQAC